MAPRNVSEIVKLAGIGNLAQIATPNNRYFAMALTGTGIAAGAAFNASQKVESGSTFVVAAITGRAWCSAAFGAAIAGSEFSRNGSGLIANNMMPPYNLVTVNFNTNSYTWFSNAVNWLDVIGTVESPNVLDFPQIVPSGGELRVTGTNGTTGTMGYSIVVHGALIRV